MAGENIYNLDQKFFAEHKELPVQPSLFHMVAPFFDGDDHNSSLQIDGIFYRNLEEDGREL